MVTTSSPALLKRWIASNLRELRETAGKSRPQVMERLGMSRAQVGHLETAERLPSKPVLEVLLSFYGVPERLPDFWRIVEAAKKGKNWWERFSEAVPPWFNLYLGLEAGAAELASFDAILVPGLLQTRQYAEAVIRADRDLSDSEVQQRVELRAGRRHVLERRKDPIQLAVVLDQSVLTRLRGSAEVMQAQLEHLLEMSRRPRVDIQVLPANAGAHRPQQGGTFSLLTFPPDMAGDPGVVYYELMTDGIYLEEAQQVAEYRREMGRLQGLAANPDESATMIEEALEYWKEVTT